MKQKKEGNFMSNFGKKDKQNKKKKRKKTFWGREERGTSISEYFVGKSGKTNHGREFAR